MLIKSFVNGDTNWHKYRKYISSQIPQNIVLDNLHELDSAINLLAYILLKAVNIAIHVRETRNASPPKKYSLNIDLLKQNKNPNIPNLCQTHRYHT